jgi:Tat protein translocase TatB subunit
MGSIGPAKILVVLVVALIVLGPEKLPQVARQAGRALAELRRIRQGLEEEVRGAFTTEDGSSPLDLVRDTVGETIATVRSLRPDPLAPGPPVRPGEPPGSGAAAGSAGSQLPAALPADLPVPPEDPSLN